MLNETNAIAIEQKLKNCNWNYVLLCDVHIHSNYRIFQYNWKYSDESLQALWHKYFSVDAQHSNFNLFIASVRLTILSTCLSTSIIYQFSLSPLHFTVSIQVNVNLMNVSANISAKIHLSPIDYEKLSWGQRTHLLNFSYFGRLEILSPVYTSHECSFNTAVALFTGARW